MDFDVILCFKTQVDNKLRHMDYNVYVNDQTTLVETYIIDLNQVRHDWI